MSRLKPLVVLIAGPNGAGKSTSAASLLRGALTVREFVNADTIAEGLSAYRSETASIAAARVMLGRLRFLASQQADFAFETTLSGRGHAQWVRHLRASGYAAHLVFLSLPDPDFAVARVAARARAGGHDVPDDVVRRRFRAGLANFFGVYEAIVGGWQMYDNTDLAGPRLIASRSNSGTRVMADPAAWQKLTVYQ